MGRLNYRYEKKTTTASSSSAPAVLFEKRVLAFVTFMLLVGFGAWLAAVATDYWVVVIGDYNGTLIKDMNIVSSY